MSHPAVIVYHNVMKSKIIFLSGSFKPSSGSEVCHSCQDGWYQLKTGQTSCLECPEGHYCPVSQSCFCLGG